jgi:hypothetical protein
MYLFISFCIHNFPTQMPEVHLVVNKSDYHIMDNCNTFKLFGGGIYTHTAHKVNMSACLPVHVSPVATEPDI